jgi:hypothetical protein
LVRSAFEEGVERYTTLFSKAPPTLMAQFTERVIMHKGVLRDPSREYLDERTGLMKRPSTATSYKWMVWITGMHPAAADLDSAVPAPAGARGRLSQWLK